MPGYGGGKYFWGTQHTQRTFNGGIDGVKGAGVVQSSLLALLLLMSLPGPGGIE